MKTIINKFIELLIRTYKCPKCHMLLDIENGTGVIPKCPSCGTLMQFKSQR
jgi:phage FluMu protein Com